MLKIKKIASVMTALCLMSAPFQVNATETEPPVSGTDVTSDEVRAVELIDETCLTSSAGIDVFHIHSLTTSFETMAEIGLIDIEIQRSSNLETWTTEKTISDKLAQNTDYHELNAYPVLVQGGYYYRVKATHYAKEDTWFFPDTQEKTQYSGAVWID